jgi:hypothetical protein
MLFKISLVFHLFICWQRLKPVLQLRGIGSWSERGSHIGYESILAQLLEFDPVF